MGLTEPLLIAVGIAGVIFMLYAFNTISLLKQGWPRLLAISAMIAVIILLSDRLLDRRLLTPGTSTNSLWDLLPGNTADVDPVARTGWQDLPLDILGILLAALGSQRTAPSVSPPPPASPALPSPAPTLPASPDLPAPGPAPTLPPSAVQPSLPSPQPSPAPTLPNPQPSFQPAPAQPYRPNPPYMSPSPVPAPAPMQPSQPPVSAWW